MPCRPHRTRRALGPGVVAIAVAVALVAAATGCSRSATPPAPGNGPGPGPAGAAAGAGGAPGVDDASTTITAAAAAARGPYNVLLVSIDSLRADMPWAGYPRPIAPHLTALYGKSIAYTRAYSSSSFTSKSIPGILTGRYPSELTRTNKFFTRYTAKSEFLCTLFDAQGIPCVAAHAHGYFGDYHPGFEAGFRVWDLVPGITFDPQTDPYVTSDKLTPLAESVLGDVAKGGKPFFAWFHYMDPHDKYQSHEESPHFGTRARDLYDEEVFFTDLWIGKLLDWVAGQPWASRTVIAVTADHGEAFGEHFMTRHAHEVWEELVHVPLFFYVPGAAPRVIDTPRGHVDLMPTFAELLGAKNVPALPGTSLVSELAGGEAAPRDVVAELPEDDLNDRRRALVHGTTKLISFGHDERFALYDLEADPHEQEDLIMKRRDLASDMRQRYRDVSKAIHEIPPIGGVVKYVEHDR